VSYAAVCCSGAALAYLDVKRGNAVKVITAELQTPHMTIAANPVIDGNPVWTAEKCMR
jgi:hypothetical protein